MLIKLTSKAERGIGLRSRSTGKLRRYEAGDELEVADSVAVGLINSNLAEQVVRQLDNGETTAESAEPDNGETTTESAEQDNEDYASMTVKELREILKKQGKPTDGTKEELLKRLKEN